MSRPAIAVGVFTALCASAGAQSFNIDFGLPGAVPPPSYAAAGIPGVWNAVQAPHTTGSTNPQPFDEMLVDIFGNATGVGLHQFGGTELIDVVPVGPVGDDANLLRDAVVTHNDLLDSCIYINGLQNGVYEVLTYAWMPNQPQVVADVFIDNAPGIANVGGAWPGQHQEGITYARHIVPVTNGFMGPHAGLLLGGDEVIGGPLNGMQLRLLGDVSTYCQGKTNSLGCVPFITASGPPSATSASAFQIEANNFVANQLSILLYSFKKSDFGFHGGTLCVKAPFTRLLPAKQADNTGGFPCTGRVKRNFNTRIQSGADPLLSVGANVFAQWMQRDPNDPAGFGDGLTNALRFTIGP